MPVGEIGILSSLPIPTVVAVNSVERSWPYRGKDET
jgi:hypothetical protein